MKLMKIQTIEKLYLSTPYWLQNILVTLYGFKEHNRRYGLAYQELKKTLKVNELKSMEELQSTIDEKLKKILRAANETPYYNDLGFKGSSLNDFPVLERSTVADNIDSLLNPHYERSELLSFFTGGSTGNPLEIYMTKEIRQKTYAFWETFYNRIGYSIGERKASFVGRKILDPNSSKPPFWRYNLRDRQLLFSSYHMSKRNLPFYFRKLNKFKPKIIEGYPHSILRLAEYILENSKSIDFKPVAISTSSEHFTSSEKAILEKAFNCKVFDQYGSAESVIFASECARGSMHIEPEYGVVEVLTQEGEIKSVGAGELIVTTLLNDAMPLIRYKIGDLGKISRDHCPCGRTTPILKELYGKVGSVIVTGENRVPTAAIALAFKYSKGISKAQVIQNELTSIIVRLVKNDHFTTSTETNMISELRRMLGSDIKISIEYKDDIAPDANGKYKLVVQNYLGSEL